MSCRPHISRYHIPERVYIGPDTREIIIIFGRRVPFTTVLPEFVIKIVDPEDNKVYEAKAYARKGDAFHFLLPEEFYSGEFCTKFFKGSVYLEDCLVECIDFIRGPVYYIRGAHTKDGSCQCQGIEWAEGLCDCKPKCTDTCPKNECSPCGNCFSKCEVLDLCHS